MALFFQRDSTLQVYPNRADGTFPASSQAFAIPMLEGFSFSQTTNSSEITLAEMESTTGTSRRGRGVSLLIFVRILHQTVYDLERVLLIPGETQKFI